MTHAHFFGINKSDQFWSVCQEHEMELLINQAATEASGYFFKNVLKNDHPDLLKSMPHDIADEAEQKALRLIVPEITIRLIEVVLRCAAEYQYCLEKIVKQDEKDKNNLQRVKEILDPQVHEALAEYSGFAKKLSKDVSLEILQNSLTRYGVSSTTIDKLATVVRGKVESPN